MMRRSATSSGLLLLLVGVVLLSAFVNGALPRLLDTLFSATPAGATAGTGGTTVIPQSGKPGPSLGVAQTGISA